MVKSGNSLSDLISTLKAMDELVCIDRVVKSGQKIHIDAEVHRKQLKWSMEADFEQYSVSGTDKKKGSGFTAFVETLKKMDREVPVDEKLIVLALVDTRQARNYDGTIHTVWCSIDPCDIGMDADAQVIDEENGYAYMKYPLHKLDLTESEYSCCSEKLALYDEFSNILYPIQPCARTSVSALLDCACVLKYRSNPVVAGSFLAERLGRSKYIRLLCRKRTDRVYPLISVVGKNYMIVSQVDFIREVCRRIQEYAIGHVSRWSVTDALTYMTYMIDGMNALWHPEIDIQIADATGNSIAVSAYIKLGHGRILLKRNSAYHTESFVRKGLDPLFDGIFEEIDRFRNIFGSVSNRSVIFDRSMLLSRKKSFGKKRWKKMEAELPKSGRYNLAEILYKVVDNTPGDLNMRYTQEIARQNKDLFYDLVHSLNIDTGDISDEKKEQAVAM